MPMERRYSHPGHLRKLIDAQTLSEVLPKPRHYLRDPLPLRAKAHNLPEDRVRALVAGEIDGRVLGVVGEPRVNVLELNLALDGLPSS